MGYVSVRAIAQHMISNFNSSGSFITGISVDHGPVTATEASHTKLNLCFGMLPLIPSSAVLMRGECAESLQVGHVPLLRLSGIGKYMIR